MYKWAVWCLTLVSVMAAVPTAETPAVSAASAILIEPTGGTVLFEKNADIVRPIASTTKLMTALVAAEWGDPDADVIVPDAACGVEGTSLGLKAGDYLSLRDLLTGMLLVSGNDAANAAALTVDESLDAFAGRMNRRAAALGMTRSHFVTPSGLDAKGHGSTARDMATLAAAVLENPLLRKIVGQSTATVAIGNPRTPRTVRNHNKLLGTLEGAIGLKTGYTKAAGRCLVSAAERGGITLICVTLNAPDDWEDHRRLFDFGFERVAKIDLALPILPALPVDGGRENQVALAAQSPQAVLPLARLSAVTVEADLPARLRAPVTAGETVGTLTFYLENTAIARVPITAATDVLALTAFEKARIRFSALLGGLLT